MRIIWITNIPIGPLCELAGQYKSPNGSWLEAAFSAIEEVMELELTIVTVARVKSIRKLNKNRHSYYVLPGGFPAEYNCNSLRNKKIWEKVKEECCPDLIQIWGTEFTHGYLALKVMKEIPAIIYMQGMIGQIARHYLSGISEKELTQSITLRDIIKLDGIKQKQMKFSKRAVIESEMIRLSGNIIVENEWCEAHCKAIAPDCNIYKSKLNIKKEFFNTKWDPEVSSPYTILSNAAGSPIKGLHFLIKALSLVVCKYPEARLVIPGVKSPFDKSFFRKLVIDGYTKYLIKLIRKFKLENNIHFLGYLSSYQMAEQMATANVFVMSSSIENHSSTLIEAMIVGTPCISSYVGGIPEYLIPNFNGLLYRFEDYEMLAFNIVKIFDDIKFGSELAKNGSNDMRNSRNDKNLGSELLGIYKKVMFNYFKQKEINGD
ncbi:MAG: glycosyltransferase [Bacteroidales bacterium]|nr:glycosyltransferase [Bacteroidales bacterium]